MINIDFINEDNYAAESEMKDISELLSFAYDYLKEAGDAEVSVSFVSNEEIKNINRDYRDKDSVTDVISFALEEDEVNIIPDDAPRTLGDIVISSDRAKEQAADYGHSYRRELLFLSLHGFLHLLGYDHMESDEEAVMNGKQEEILNAYGVTRD
ncbi:Endoribonuclease YbeY [Jeotgalicoccus aerolatus]|jgi:probable rRNA maturation factor|uniref:Endoribonuclease YbeY n=1 Tax=Jeotgalicoccus aerolatus TaxID=709510 RepID=A0A1G8ULU8_9STAP|nr:rRNA maturation RNase YbeY [Jeotgalicoccus aerolatus]MBP1951686.1 putative rRNA maturation factor [Jeotgalicoccus aerolatus]NMA82108.1 rRNA maturation RNase YbeY [Jeotgalicoccus aerolatus]CAD2075591.1 Endoribonuclease YbeY [Jeotgalicoccus aerolatus]SDJ54699.1 probable rRNA maturation factor [Jeotgalicoccus aerolatus]GGD95595.1 endoribonuclease YbeY [Jeotgalicoccus aerolatus]